MSRYAHGLALPIRIDPNGRVVQVDGAAYVTQCARLAVTAGGAPPYVDGYDLEEGLFGTGVGVQSKVRSALAPMADAELATVADVRVTRSGGRLTVDTRLTLIETGDAADVRVDLGGGDP